jgi:hypothetical protein
MLEGIILAVVGGGFGIVLTFILSRNREVTSMAHQVIASTNTYFNVIETLKKVAFIQGQRIDQWERWGREFSERVSDACPDMVPPKMPDLHLDLRPFWAEIDSAVDEMNQPDKKRTRRKPPFSNVGGTMGGEDDE